MQTTNVDKAAVAARALDALRRGDAAGSRAGFESIVASGQADAAIHVGLAFACRALRDAGGAMAAINGALALEPRNLQALILKADLLAGAGDLRAASAFYRAAVKLAPAPERLPPQLRGEVQRASGECNRYAAMFESHLQQWLARSGWEGGSESPRFRESLELLFGRREIFFPRPRYYFFPGLPQIQFYDRALLPWMDGIEAATPAIRAELLEVLRGGESDFKPYVEGDSGRPYHGQDGMLNNPAWSAFYLWKNGELVAENAARCPQTMRALEAVPLTRAPNRSPSVLFSLLRPGAHIPPHNGMVNTRLICHLPLIVPGACSFRVGNETRDWVEGRAWAFDDTVEHEAWNRSDATRVILLFEVWKPELTEAERAQVNAMFEAIDSHAGEKPAWEI